MDIANVFNQAMVEFRQSLLEEIRREIRKEVTEYLSHVFSHFVSAIPSHREMPALPGIPIPIPRKRERIQVRKIQGGTPLDAELPSANVLRTTRKYHDILLYIFQNKCSVCSSPITKKSQAAFTTPGLKINESLLLRISTLVSDLKKGEKFVRENYQYICRGCTISAASLPKEFRGSSFWYPGHVKAREQYMRSFSLSCSVCQKKPKISKNLLTQGPEKNPDVRLISFYKTLIDKGESEAKARYPSICRSCWSHKHEYWKVA